MIDLQQYAEEILQKALQNGGDLAEIYLEERAIASLSLDDGKVEKIISGTEAGAGIRILLGDKTLYAHSNDVSREGLLKLAETVAGGASGPKTEYSFAFAPECFAATVKQSAQDVPTAKKLDLITAANAAARAHDPRIAQVTVRYGDSLRRIVIANSDGRLVEETRPQTLLMVQVVAAKDGIIQTGYKAVAGTLGYELFDDEDPEDVALKAARQACLMLDADPAPTGRMPVVLSSEAGGTMVHEAVGHGLEADLIDKGMSKFCGRLGEEIAAPIVTVVDDGTIPQKRGTGTVDDEGTPTQRTVLVENGRLVRFMNDLRTARKMSHEPSGNGRRQSYQYKPVPRMTNTLIAPGKDDPQEILASTDRGLFVRKMGGGQVNTLNGDFVFEVSEGYLIENGKAETPVRGATLIGNGPEIMGRVSMVAGDFALSPGMWNCGKRGQGVPVNVGLPHVLISEITVGGTRGSGAP